MIGITKNAGTVINYIKNSKRFEKVVNILTNTIVKWRFVVWNKVLDSMEKVWVKYIEFKWWVRMRLAEYRMMLETIRRKLLERFGWEEALINELPVDYLRKLIEDIKGWVDEEKERFMKMVWERKIRSKIWYANATIENILGNVWIKGEVVKKILNILPDTSKTWFLKRNMTWYSHLHDGAIMKKIAELVRDGNIPAEYLRRDGKLKLQIHHFLSNKNNLEWFTENFEDILERYKLDLDGDWNKWMVLPHAGNHMSNEWWYHKLMLTALKIADERSKWDVRKIKYMMEQINVFVVENAEEVLKWVYKGRVIDYPEAKEIINNDILNF